MSTSKNDITGDLIASRAPSDKYLEQYEKIDWSKKEEKSNEAGIVQR